MAAASHGGAIVRRPARNAAATTDCARPVSSSTSWGAGRAHPAVRGAKEAMLPNARLVRKTRGQVSPTVRRWPRCRGRPDRPARVLTRHRRSCRRRPVGKDDFDRRPGRHQLKRSLTRPNTPRSPPSSRASAPRSVRAAHLASGSRAARCSLFSFFGCGLTSRAKSPASAGRWHAFPRGGTRCRPRCPLGTAAAPRVERGTWISPPSTIVGSDVDFAESSSASRRKLVLLHLHDDRRVPGRPPSAPTSPSPERRSRCRWPMRRHLTVSLRSRVRARATARRAGF